MHLPDLLSCNLKVQLLAEFLYKRVLFNQHCILLAFVADVSLNDDFVHDNSHLHYCVSQKWSHSFADTLPLTGEEVRGHLVVYGDYKALISLNLW